MPSDRWGNIVQDILTCVRDSLVMSYRYRFLAVESSVITVGNTVKSMLQHVPHAMLTFGRPWCDHQAIENEPSLIVKAFEKSRAD